MADEWKDYERRTLSVFQTTGYECRFDVRRTGARVTHQIDIEVDALAVGASHLWIVECKLWKTPVKKQQVLAFKGVIDDIGADHGFILCESGFQSGAVELAKSINITLCTLESLDKRFLSWQINPLSETSRHYRSHIRFIPDDGNLSGETIVSIVPTGSREASEDIAEIHIFCGSLVWILSQKDAARFSQPDGSISLSLPWDLPCKKDLRHDMGYPGYCWYLNGAKVQNVCSSYYLFFRTRAGSIHVTTHVDAFK